MEKPPARDQMPERCFNIPEERAALLSLLARRLAGDCHWQLGDRGVLASCDGSAQVHVNVAFSLFRRGGVASSLAEQHPLCCKQRHSLCANHDLQLPVLGRNGPVPDFGLFPSALMLAGGPSTFLVLPRGNKVGIQPGVRDRPRDAEPRQHSEILYLHAGSVESKSDPFYHIQVTLVPSPK